MADLSLRLLAASCLVVSLAACGGNVSVGRSSSSTTSGAGGGGVTTTQTTPTPNPVPEPGALCDRLCQELAAAKCNADGDCVKGCSDSITKAGACASKLEAVYLCMEPLLAQCPKDPPSQCATELKAFEDCMGTMPSPTPDPPPTGGCSDSGPCAGTVDSNGVQSCSCTATCAGGPVEAKCTTQNGSTSCDCIQNGVVVSSCGASSPGGGAGGAPDPGNACSLTQGCCAGVFK